MLVVLKVFSLLYLCITSGVAPQLTVVMSTTAPLDAEAHAEDARAASEESSEGVVREAASSHCLRRGSTLALRGWGITPHP